MKEIVIHSVNLIADMASYKNIKALDIFFECLQEFLPDNEIDLIIEESAMYLQRSNPKIAKWFEYQIQAIMVEDNSISTIEDLKHILLDEGFNETNLDFEITDKDIKVSEKVKLFLEDNYDYKQIQGIFNL